jgi:hypothetical protein
MVDVVIASDLTDAIPLLDEGTTPGLYNKGRNNINDFGIQWLGMMIGKTGNNPSTFRNGVIAPGSHIGGVIHDLKVTGTGGAGTQAVHVLAGRSIVNRSNRPYLLTQQSNMIGMAAPAADGSNPRIDILCQMPYDKGGFPADAQHGPKYIWVRGDPAGSPSVPALPAAVSEALPLCRINRPAGDNTIADADITDMRASAGIHGTPRVLLGADTTAGAGAYHGELRMRVSEGNNIWVPATLAAQGAKTMIDYWDAVNTTWRGISPGSIRLVSSTIGPHNNVASGAVEFAVAGGTIAIPDPGYPYRLRMIADLTCNLNPGTAFIFRVRDGAVGGTALMNGTAGFTVSRNGATAGSGLHGTFAYPEYTTASILTGSRNAVLTATPAYADGAALAAIPQTGNVTFEIIPA